MNIEFLNGICYIGTYGMLSLPRFGKHGSFPIESYTFTNWLNCSDIPAYPRIFQFEQINKSRVRVVVFLFTKILEM